MTYQRLLATGLAITSMFFLPLSSHAMSMSHAKSNLRPGDLIKGSGATVYYFGPNGKRFVFPNSKTYFTWYADFSHVITIPDNHLSAIPLGGNVTYKPGYKLVKITTDPKVYAVDRSGFLRWVTSEQLATTLYGINWQSRVDDIPDEFFTNYRTGSSIQLSSDYVPSDVMTLTSTIALDKNLDLTQVTVNIANTNDGFVPTTFTVKKGTTVTWTNNDFATVHTVTGDGWDLGIVQPGKSVSKTFNAVGSFSYYCSNHPGMQAGINVLP